MVYLRCRPAILTSASRGIRIGCLALCGVALAVALFHRNSELHPNEWNVRDSLAEAEARAGDRASAIVHYRRSVELHPLNGNGWRALGQLETSGA